MKLKLLCDAAGICCQEKYFDWDEAFNYGIITDDLDLDFMYFVDWLNLEEENENEE